MGEKRETPFSPFSPILAHSRLFSDLHIDLDRPLRRREGLEQLLVAVEPFDRVGQQQAKPAGILCLRLRHVAHAELDLSFGDFSAADFAFANLARAMLARTNLAGATLHQAELAFACFNHSNLAGTELDGALCDHAVFVPPR